MSLYINNLAIEVTRKCNMQCEHCLRGPAQRKTIDNQYIYKILRLIDDVSTLTITGGEPTLAMDSLEHIKHCVMYNDCDVQSFFMVTNGKAINVEKLALWAYQMRNCCSDNEMSSVGFSFDQFHQHYLNCSQLEKQQRNFYNLKEILEYNYGIFNDDSSGDFITKHSDDSLGYHNLISEGRAKDFGCRDNNISTFEKNEWSEGDISFGENVLYLSCSGYLVADCNWSYHSMDNNKKIRIAHIDDINCQDDLIEAIKKYNHKVEKKELQYA